MGYIKQNDLKPGDVIMCRGEGLFSDTIVFLDRGTYSHAALYVGMIDGEHRAVQATSAGILCTNMRSISRETFADVYRFDKDGHVFGNEGYESQDVIDIAFKYVDSDVKYANDHLVILAILALTRDIPIDSFKEGFIREIFDKAADHLFNMMDKGVKPMVCSEAVYRFFKEAGPESKYKLRVNSEISLENNAKFKSKELDKSANKFMLAYYESKKNGFSIDEYIDSCISPKDLERSKDLKLIGRLQFE